MMPVGQLGIQSYLHKLYLKDPLVTQKHVQLELWHRDFGGARLKPWYIHLPLMRQAAEGLLRSPAMAAGNGTQQGVAGKQLPQPLSHAILQISSPPVR